MEVTYRLSTSECMSSHNSKWRKEQSFIFNHTYCVRISTKYDGNWHTEHKWMHEFTQQYLDKSSHSFIHLDKSSHSFLITHLVFNYQPNIKLTHILSTSECISSHSSKWRKEQPFILIADLVLECYTKRKVAYSLNTSDCMSSHSSKWREEQSYILNRRSCVRMLTKYKSNLPTEYKWMYEFTQQQVEKRATIHS